MGRTLTVSTRGTVISVHEYGATVRLEDGSLAAIALTEFIANRAIYAASRDARRAVDLCVVRAGARATATLYNPAPPDVDAIVREAVPADAGDLPTRTNIAFEMRLGAYLRETEAWAPSDRPAPAERHFIRKKHRADVFEARKKTT